MSHADDLQFHIRRQEQELKRAYIAVNDVAGAIHLELAEEHARRGARAKAELELEQGSATLYPSSLASF